jgi:fused signal recognition particle receptor
VTTQTLWIVVAVVVAVLLIAALLGLVLRRQRRISLREAQQLEREPGPTPPRKGGTYKAESGFSFSAGPTAAPTLGEAAPVAPPPGASDVPPEAAPTSTPQPGVPGIAPEAAPQAPPPDAAELRPAQAPEEAAPATPADTVAPERAAPEPVGPTAETAVPEAPPETTDREAPPETPTPERDTAPPAAETVAPPAPERSSPALPTTPYPPTAPTLDEPRSANGSAPTVAPPPTTAPPTTTPPTTAPAAPPVAPAPAPTPAAAAPAPTAPAAPSEAIDPAEGRLDRLRGRLARSRSGFGQGLLGLLGAGELDEESWEDVEATLLQADLGPEMTAELVETLRVELARRAVRTPAQARQLLRDVLTDALRPELDRSVAALPHDGRPAVLLVVGVNGAGKTTTVGKIARVLVGDGKSVVLGAADTFRAAAADQLETWGERVGVLTVRGREGGDPASVAFEAVRTGTEAEADTVVVDTAGRLHTKSGLMDELGKVKRVVEKIAPVTEVLLVLDATTGQNGVVQARVFTEAVAVTGVVLTKLDGTAKGGIVVRVQNELGIPVKLIGLGEGPDDLAPFEPRAFAEGLVGGED